MMGADTDSETVAAAAGDGGGCGVAVNAAVSPFRVHGNGKTFDDVAVRVHAAEIELDDHIVGS